MTRQAPDHAASARAFKPAAPSAGHRGGWRAGRLVAGWHISPPHRFLVVELHLAESDLGVGPGRRGYPQRPVRLALRKALGELRRLVVELADGGAKATHLGLKF